MDYVRISLAGLVVCGFLAVVLLCLSGVVKISTADPIINMLLGALAAAFTTVLTWYFGSSKGSEDKTELLAQSQQSAIPSTSGVQQQ